MAPRAALKSGRRERESWPLSPGWPYDTLFALPDWGERRDISRLDEWVLEHVREAPWRAWHAWPGACWLGAGLGLDLSFRT